MTSLLLPGAEAWRLPEDPPPALLSFLETALPTLLRRLRLWKGLASDRHQDIIEDLLQELWVDYLTHTEHLLAMPPAQRHLRWFRLLARAHYRWREQGRRHLSGEKLQELVHEAPAVGGLDGLAPGERRLLDQVQEQACYLKNGRLNAQETARRLRVSPQAVHDLWEQVAEASGLGNGFVGFWCLRLAEALTALGIELLRGSGNRQHCLRRVRRIRNRLAQRPLPPDLRALLARYRRRTQALTPLQVLTDSAELRPDHPVTERWLLRARQQSATAARRAGSRSAPSPGPDPHGPPSCTARQAG